MTGTPVAGGTSAGTWGRPALAAVLAVLVLCHAGSAWAQKPGQEDPPTTPPAGAGSESGDPPGPATAGQVAAADQDEADRTVRWVEPDFSVIALPTTLRVPRHAGTFRLTHRFTRALNVDGIGNLASDLFGLDGGAVIGLEFRYGLARGLHAGVYRTSDKTIELFGQYDVFQQSPSRPVGLNLIVGVEGADNFTEEYSPIIGAVVSRAVADRLALYAQPLWVGHTRQNSDAEALDGHDHGDGTSTFVLGLGARARVGGGTYLTVEVAPRLAGYAPEDMHISFGIEKRAGGHVFQLNVSNGIGTTPAQIARGVHNHGRSFWYLGFNLSRKFY